MKQSDPNNPTVHEEWAMCDAFRTEDQLLSLNSRTCFGSLLFSPVLSLTGTKTRIEGLVWLAAELKSFGNDAYSWKTPMETSTLYAKSDDQWRSTPVWTTP